MWFKILCWIYCTRVSAKDANNTIDAIKYFQFCLNLYAIKGICNPQKLAVISKYQLEIKLLAINAGQYLIDNKNLTYNSNALIKAENLILKK